ncbi:MAG: phosphoenolpyruvate carboxylase [Alphaproteobacteria bacterium]|nr:phosphoenolpyruvate carboxylase [Alphaproteobacteria bacterium]
MPFDSNPTPEAYAAALQSTDAKEIASALCSGFLAELAKKDPELATDLGVIISEVLNAPDIESLSHEDGLAAAQARQARLAIACESLVQRYMDSPQRLRLLTAGYAKLGKILELSGHLARENFFDIRRQARNEALADFDPNRDARAPVLRKADMVPGGIEHLLFKIKDSDEGSQRVFKTAREAVDGLSQSAFMPVLTQHPTNIDTLETWSLMRDMHDAAREVSMHGPEHAAETTARLQHVMGGFLGTELTPLGPDGAPRAFTPFEEMEFALYTMENAFNYLPDTYDTFDQALTRRFGSSYGAAEQRDLNLNFRMGSWAMGDKDGNANLKAEHLLLATIQQRRLALRLYHAELAELRRAGVTLDPDIEALDAAFVRGMGVLDKQLAFLEARRKGGADIPLTQTEFDQITAATASALGTEGGQPLSFAAADARMGAGLERTHKATRGGAKKSVLTLMRQQRAFGLHMAQIEMRETSEVYTDIIGLLVTQDPATGAPVNYAALTGAERTALLERIVREHPGWLQQQADAFLRDIDDTGALRTYSESDPRAIAYHTLKRLQLARENPDMFQDMILAECKGAGNVMEAVALQKMVDPSLHLHVTPLLEEPETLRSATSLVRDLMHLPAYRQHLLACAGGDPSKISLCIQVAHSDNVRRGGSLAARSAIHAIHREIPAFLRQHRAEFIRLFKNDGVDTSKLNIDVEWFEGGSMSDSLRGGVRSVTAAINGFGLHRFVKMTFQGGDLFNYFNFGTSFRRLVVRLFNNNAKIMFLNKDKPSQVQAIEDGVGRALERCYEDYTAKHFNDDPNPIGFLFAHPLVNYPLYSVIGNRSSRSAVRGDGSSTVYADPERGTQPIATNKLRTIGFSNNLNDANLQGSWLGGQNVIAYLNAEITPGKAAGQALLGETPRGVTVFSGGKLTAAGIQALYRTSPNFRDVIDYMAYGLLVSDVGRLQRRMHKGVTEAGIPLIDGIGQYINDTLPRDYAAASELVLAAFGQLPPGQILESHTRGHAATVGECASLRHRIEMQVLPHLREEVSMKRDYIMMMETVRDQILMCAWKEGRRGLTNTELATLSDAASGASIFRHGRIFAADDPHYGAELRHHRQQRAAGAAPA